MSSVLLLEAVTNLVGYRSIKLKMESEGLFARDAPYRSGGCELLTFVFLLIVFIKRALIVNEHDDRGSGGERGIGFGGRGGRGRGRDRRGGRWIRSRGGRGHRGGGASPRPQSQDEDGDFSMDDLERGSKIR